MTFILSEGLALLPLIVGVLAVVFIPFVSKVPEWFATLVHEIGHGVIAIPFGGFIGGIKVNSDGSGSADTKYAGGLLYKPVRIISLLMGYAFPVYIGIALLISAYYENTSVGGWILGIMGILVLFCIRNLFGLLIVIGYEALFVTFFVLNVGDTLTFMTFVGLLFIVRGLIDFIMVAPLVFGEDTDEDETDFHLLRDEALLPRQFWYVFFILFHGIILHFFFTNIFTFSISF